MKGIPIMSDTDFELEDDFPVFLLGKKLLTMHKYANDNNAVVTEYITGHRFVVERRLLVFLCWLKEIDNYPECLI